MSEQALCTLCGEPMPAGEEMFNYHGYSGPCPKPPLTRPTEARPFYRKVANGKHNATQLFMITVDEGWRTSILCDGMYEWAADWLVEQLQHKPYPKSPEESKP